MPKVDLPHNKPIEEILESLASEIPQGEWDKVQHCANCERLAAEIKALKADIKVIMDNAAMDGDEKEWAVWDRLKEVI